MRKLATLACILTACATAPTPKVDVAILQTSPIGFAVTVTNQSPASLALRSIDFDEIGQGESVARGAVHIATENVGEALAPGASKQIAFWAASGLTRPVSIETGRGATLRATAHFEGFDVTQTLNVIQR